MTRAAISWNINQVVKGIGNGTITSDNAIQRGFVWDKKRMSLLIDTVLRDYTIPPIYTIRTPETIKVKGKEVSVYDLIDGKQRTTTFAKFMNNEFALEGLEPFAIGDEEVDLNGKTFGELDEDMQDAFKSYGLTVYYFSDISDDEIADMMSRLNNGKPLTGTENARIKAKNLPAIQELAGHNLLTNYLSDVAIKGYANEDIVIKLALLMSDITELSAKNVRMAYETYDFNAEDVERITKTMDYVLECVENCTGSKKIIKRITSKTNLVTILFTAFELGDFDKEVFTERLAEFFGSEDGATVSADYNEACTNGTMRSTNVITRNDELYAYMTK